VVQPPRTTGEPSEGAPTTAAIALRRSPIAVMSPMAGCLRFTPSLRTGRPGGDHVTDQLVLVVAATPRAVAQLGRGGGGDLVEGRPGRGDQARAIGEEAEATAGAIASATVPMLAEPTSIRREAFTLIGAVIPITVK
jgi:hypothetical protein